METPKLFVPPLSYVNDVGSAKDFDCLVVVTDSVQGDDYPGKNVIDALIGVLRFYLTNSLF